MWRPGIKVEFVRLWRGEVSICLLYFCILFLTRILYGHPVWLAGRFVLYTPVCSLWEYPSPVVIVLTVTVLYGLYVFEDGMEG